MCSGVCDEREQSQFEEVAGTCIDSGLGLRLKSGIVKKISKVNGAGSDGIHVSILKANADGVCRRTLKGSHRFVCSVTQEHWGAWTVWVQREVRVSSTCTRRVGKAHGPLYRRFLLLFSSAFKFVFISFSILVILQNEITYTPKNCSAFEKFNTITILFVFWKLHLG